MTVDEAKKVLRDWIMQAPGNAWVRMTIGRGVYIRLDIRPDGVRVWTFERRNRLTNRTTPISPVRARRICG